MGATCHSYTHNVTPKSATLNIQVLVMLRTEDPKETQYSVKRFILELNAGSQETTQNQEPLGMQRQVSGLKNFRQKYVNPKEPPTFSESMLSWGPGIDSFAG
ncbi:hypothetical protein AMECASPLE_013288 [Ameca splendens]|uniref:Uncharacterized protein n=1 Tax=Ameca splendens TaxID=208324 RepID=A0ABV0Z107_9TELE